VTDTNRKKEITVFMPSLESGGAERIVLKLINGLVDRGINVVLILATPYGSLHSGISPNVKIVNLNHSRTVYSIFSLANYLKKNKPPKLLSHLHRANRIALLAKIISISNTKIFVVLHTTVSEAIKHYSFFKRIIFIITIKYLYLFAANIIHVSKAAATDLRKYTSKKVDYIYNPIVDNQLLEGGCNKINNSWSLDDNEPFILSVGRIGEPKDYYTLINAFEIVVKIKSCKLVIIGDGKLKDDLNNTIRQKN
jgi:glycosyltransferase involved in cell wall biosynthesis